MRTVRDSSSTRPRFVTLPSFFFAAMLRRRVAAEAVTCSPHTRHALSTVQEPAGRRSGGRAGGPGGTVARATGATVGAHRGGLQPLL